MAKFKYLLLTASLVSVLLATPAPARGSRKRGRKLAAIADHVDQNGEYPDAARLAKENRKRNRKLKRSKAKHANKTSALKSMASSLMEKIESVTHHLAPAKHEKTEIPVGAENLEDVIKELEKSDQILHQQGKEIVGGFSIDTLLGKSTNESVTQESKKTSDEDVVADEKTQESAEEEGQGTTAVSEADLEAQAQEENDNGEKQNSDDVEFTVSEVSTDNVPIQIGRRSGAVSSVKPKTRSQQTQSLRFHYYNQIFKYLMGANTETCAGRNQAGLPTCCSGEDNLCTSSAQTCSCDNACLYFNDCCSDYKQMCKFTKVKLADYPDREIYFSQYIASYQEAMITCEDQLGGSLLMIKDSSFHKSLERVLSSGTLGNIIPNMVIDYWIGLDDLSKEGRFMHADGTTLLSLKALPWAPNNPAKGRAAAYQDCVTLLSKRSFQLADSQCKLSKRFICQKRTMPDKFYNKGVGRVLGNPTPFINTFDKFLVHLESSCSYILTELCDNGKNTFLDAFYVVGDITADDQGNNQLENVHLYLLDGVGGEVTKTISILKNKLVKANGQAVNLPYEDNHGNLVSIQGKFVRITTASSLNIYFDGEGHLEFEAPFEYWGQLCGLLGNYNYNVNDDFTDRYKKPINSLAEYQDLWKTNDDPSCNLQTSYPEQKDCPAENLVYVDKLCEKLLSVSESNPLIDCVRQVESSMYFEMCATDICSRDLEELEQFEQDNKHCVYYESFMLQCKRGNRISIDWRSEEFCPVTCPDNAEYNHCGESCQTTCVTNKNPLLGFLSECPKCVEGCFCKPGYMWNSANECVKEENCSCHDNLGNKVAPGESQLNFDCSQKCTCDAETFSMVCEDYACPSPLVCDMRDSSPDTSGFCDVLRVDANTDLSCLEEGYVVPTEKPKFYQEFKGFHGSTHPGGAMKSILSESDKESKKVLTMQRPKQDGMRSLTDPLYIKPNRCCGIPSQAIPYNDETHGCCNGRIFNRETHKCCTDTGFNVKIESDCPAGGLVQNMDPIILQSVEQHQQDMLNDQKYNAINNEFLSAYSEDVDDYYDDYFNPDDFSDLLDDDGYLDLYGNLGMSPQEF